MRYTDLELSAAEPEVTREEGAKLVRFKLHMPGVLSASLPWAYDAERLQSYVEAVSRPEATWSEALALGVALGTAILPEPLRAALEERLARARTQDEGLRLRLLLAGEELQRLPWECLLLNRRGDEAQASDFLALTPHLSIVRHAATPLPAWRTVAEGPARLAVGLSSPSGRPPLRLADERRVLEESVERNPRLQGRLQVDWASPLRRPDLPDRTRPAHLFHFAGRGDLPVISAARPVAREGRGALILDDGHGGPDPLPSELLALHLRDAGVRVAVLGPWLTARPDDVGAWSSVAEALLQAELGAVVAMQFVVADRSAVAFAARFYEALLGGLPIDEAVGAGRMALAEAGDVRGWGAPVLFLRGADGVVFPEYAQDPEREGAREQLRVESRMQADQVLGRLTGVKIDALTAGHVSSSLQLGTVGPQATATGLEIGRLGGPAAAPPPRQEASGERGEEIDGQRSAPVGGGSLGVQMEVGSVTGGEVVAVKIGTQFVTHVQVYALGAPGAFGAASSAVAPAARYPYQGLDSFGFGDRAVFRGRAALARAAAAHILAHPTSALAGRTAVGKTSLVHAGIIPALAGRGDSVALVVRDYEHPEARLREGLQRLPGLQLSLPQEGGLVELALAFARQTSQRLVLFCDQFERLLALTEMQREVLIRPWADLLAAREAARLCLVFVLRSEFHAAAADLQARVSGLSLVGNVYTVPGLTCDEAREAILWPLQIPGGIDRAAVEPGLLDQYILPQIAISGAAGQEEARIDPARLQVVCSRLYDRACAAVAGTGKQPLLSVALFREMGQVEGILRCDLSARLSQLAESSDRELPRKILFRLAASAPAYFAAAGPLAAALDRDEAETRTWLERLAAVRLVEAGESGFGLAPLYLREEIAHWYDDEETAEAAGKALARALADWDYERIPTGRRRLQRIRSALAGLQPDLRALGLLLRSAALAEADPGFWAAWFAGDEHARATLLALEKGSDAAKDAADLADVLGLRQGGRLLSLSQAALEAARPEVRVAAALALSALGEQITQDALWPRRHGPPRGRCWAALAALAWIRYSGLDRDWRHLGVEPLVVAGALRLRMLAHRVRIATLAASALVGTSLVGLVLPLVHLLVALGAGLPNLSLEFISSLAVGVVIGGMVGALYGLADVIPAPGRRALSRALRAGAVVWGAALANAFLIGASLGRWPGWPPLLIGGLAGSGFAVGNEGALGLYPGRRGRRLLLGCAGLGLSAALAALVTTWRISALGLQAFRDRLPWQFAGGLNTLLFPSYPAALGARVAYVFWSLVSGAIIGLGLAGGLAAGDALAAELRRARDV